MLRKLLTGILAALAFWFALFALYPLHLPAPVFAYDLRSGSTLRSVAHDLSARHLLWEPWTFTMVGRLLGRQTHIKAGSYEWDEPLSALELLNKITRGDSVQNEAKLIEGMTFAQFRASLDANQALSHLTPGLSEGDILKLLGSQAHSAEGLFFPDTYFFNKGDSDLGLMKRAFASMRRKLDAVWQHRAPDLPYKDEYEALTMASIIEKETAKPDERPLIASVFINRLHLGMKLQTDPTVIYGMGDRYQGNIHKRDLLRDTPYNTYTREGLPPSPIAMPGLASLEAAVHPADSTALYFVARGDGSHAFSDNLNEHNQAVYKYQIKHHTP
ncbi:MAG: endolytic transglycosylase MltG [Betaproteobacteria bacterium]|nr:endolytic transglycosylase MltG [Betaproteobacteria bacterium]MDE2622211.1 endolytic transglycosylase MltG [Betaproteobacteria bacterium]